jgi:FkbM family methyltransferase
MPTVRHGRDAGHGGDVLKMNLAKKLFVTLRGVAGHPLNRGAGFRAMRQFCVAQLAVRLVPGDISVPFPNRTHLLISPRMKGAAHFITPGLCEYEEMVFVTHFLRPGDVFVDGGANVGAYTLLASGVAGARTIAVEPSPSTFGYLRQNVFLNDLATRVTLVNAALGRSAGKLRLTEDLGTENYVCADGEAGPSVEVPVTTLDSLVTEASVTLFKVDVEGFETEVLAGAQRLLASGAVQAMIVERAGNGLRYGYDEAVLHRKIQDHGYAPFAYDPTSRLLRKLAPESPGNIIYLMDPEAVARRLKEAPPIAYGSRMI